jgi:hypothetical protein
MAWEDMYGMPKGTTTHGANSGGKELKGIYHPLPSKLLLVTESEMLEWVFME